MSWYDLTHQEGGSGDKVPFTLRETYFSNSLKNQSSVFVISNWRKTDQTQDYVSIKRYRHLKGKSLSWLMSNFYKILKSTRVTEYGR